MEDLRIYREVVSDLGDPDRMIQEIRDRISGTSQEDDGGRDESYTGGLMSMVHGLWEMLVGGVQR